MKRLNLCINVLLFSFLIMSLLAFYVPSHSVYADEPEIPGISITKTVFPDRIHAGEPVTYSITLSNDSLLTCNFEVQDTMLDFSENVSLNPEESRTYNIPFNPTEDVTNTAGALATAIGGDIFIPPVLITANATVDVIHPAVEVTKTAMPTTVLPGETVTYTITVTNSGDTWLEVDVIDDILGTIASDMALDAGTVVDFVVTDTPTADVTNTVTVTGFDEIGGTVFDSASASVAVSGADTTPPVITSNPQVTNIMPGSVEIIWDTDEPSDSMVNYGSEAGEYPLSVTDETLLREHSIVLDGLLPGTTYHFIVESRDAAENAVFSRDITFSTPSLPDSTPPTIMVSGPLNWQEVTLLSGEASDDTGIAMLEFFVDGELVFTDYSAPFEFYLDSSMYENGSHTITGRAFDNAGNFYEESATVDVVNVKDTSDPMVIITSPVQNETISEKYTVNATLTDDTGLFKATLRVAKKGETSSEWWGDWYPPSGTPTTATAAFSLDTRSLENGEYRLAVEVYDKDINYGVGTVDIIVSNAPPLPPPDLTVSRTVIRTQNYFTVTLKVKNTGGETATNVRLLDYLQLFQPINKNTNTAQYSAEYNTELTNWGMNIISNVDIAAGQTRTYSYDVVPVLIYPGSVTPMIGGHKYAPPGGSIRLWYEDMGGTNTYYDDFGLLFSPSTSGSSYDDALKEADYLIVTNPANLLRLNATADVNQLLSSMAELAMLKNGVLGFLDVPPSYYRDFEANDGLAIGDTLADTKAEIIVGDVDRNLISTAHVPNKPLPITNTISYDITWQEYWGFKCGNYEEGFDAGDRLATGILIGGAKDQIIMTDSSADKFIVYDGNGKLIWCYVISTGEPFEHWDIEEYDGLAAGNLNGVGTEDIVFADRSENKILILNLPLPTPNTNPAYNLAKYADIISQFSKDFEKDDGLAVGDVMGDPKEEIIIADRSADKVYVFTYTGSLISQFYCDFEAGDSLAVGNVIYTWPTNKSEIIIGDISKDRLYVYQADGKLVSSIPRDMEGYDGLISGNVHGTYVDDVIVADRSDDSLDIHNFTYANGSKYQLKDLIKAEENSGLFWTSDPVATGAWSKKLKSDWISNGYLLIVGETEIIPAWGDKNFGTVLTTRGNEAIIADITDYPYASTYGEDIKPELSIGRIIGNTAQELRKPIEASIQVAKGTSGYDFDRSHALSVSGYPAGLGGGSDSIDFQSEALKDALTLKNNGIDPIYMNTPDYTVYDSNGAIDTQATQTAIANKFFNNVPGKDVIFLAGHGNPSGWDQIYYLDVLSRLNPFGSIRPFIFASSCSTGRYVHVYSVANAFLSRGAAVYIGATNWGLGSHQWISNYLYQSWDPGEPIGLAVKQVKQSIGGYSVPAAMFGGGTSGYVVNNKERYWSAIYHVLGDPKYGSEGPPASGFAASQYALIESEPPSSVEIQVPYYEVLNTEEGDAVNIPGGGMMAVEGFPALPYYQVMYNYPADYEIQDVTVTGLADAITESGLEIPPVIISVGEESGPDSPNYQYEDPIDWWPETPFTWEVIEGPETDTLVITVFPIQYNPSSTEIRFYQNYVFDIGYLTSGIQITSLSTDQPFYPAGEMVNINVQLRNEDTETGQNVVVSAVIKDEASEELVDGLPLLTLNNLRGTASCSFDWDSDAYGSGDYMIKVEIRDQQGSVLERESAGFSLVEDFTPPNVEITQPLSGQTVFDGGILAAAASDDTEVTHVYFHITGSTETSDTSSQAKGIPATLDSGTPQEGVWTMVFDATGLPDGNYTLTAEAVDSGGNTAWSEPVTFKINRNVVVGLLPPSKKYNPGRTMPVKFSVFTAPEINPVQAFVYLDDLEIRIIDAGSGVILQTSRYGNHSTSYRIETQSEMYITNFKTDKQPKEYVVEVWRLSTDFMLGSFVFATK